MHNIIEMYGVADFADTLGDFIAGVLNNTVSRNATQYRGENVYLSFSRVPVYYYMKFTVSSNPNESSIINAVHAQPEQMDLHGQIIPSHFDTVLVKVENKSIKGVSDFHPTWTLINGYTGPRVVQVRVIFQILTMAIP